MRVERRMTIDQLAERLALSRSTVYYSDPAVVKLSDRWMRTFARAAPFYSLEYHADQRLEDLREFWGSELNSAGDQINLQRKSNR